MLLVRPINDSVLDHSEVLLLCNISANPAAVITWTKDGDKLQPNDRFIMSADGTLLRIRNIRRLNAGIYECRAENYVGHVIGTAIVDVIGEANG